VHARVRALVPFQSDLRVERSKSCRFAQWLLWCKSSTVPSTRSGAVLQPSNCL